MKYLGPFSTRPLFAGASFSSPFSKGQPPTLVRGKLRITNWQRTEAVVLLTPATDVGQLDSTHIWKTVESLAQQGVHRCITPALNQFETRPFLDAGFVFHEHLHLLTQSLPLQIRDPASPPGVSLKMGRRRSTDQVLHIDRHAFDSFWRFDASALKQACQATPSSWYRIAVINGDVAGYAITGRSRNRGYLQRLAVHPAYRGNGIGRSLVFDSLRWLETKKVSQALVNTQTNNTAALGLYKKTGYRLRSEGLVVLRWDSSRHGGFRGETGDR